MNTSVHDAVVMIIPSQEEAFRKRLEGLNKKAAKFGLEPIKVLQSKDVPYQIKVEDLGNDRQAQSLVPLPAGEVSRNPVILRRYSLSFPIVKLGDWQVVGKLESVEQTNLAFLITKDEADLLELRRHADHKLHCQHCNTRRNRKDGFLLRETGSSRYLQVGKNCLQDFTGIDPAAALFLAQMWSVIRACDEDLSDFWGRARANAVHTLSYLAKVSFLTKTYGFVSAARAREECVSATFDDALGLQRAMERDAELRSRYDATVEEHMKCAHAVRAWAQAKDDGDLFFLNAKRILAEECIAIDRKRLAIAAGAVARYASELAATERARRGPSAFVGEPGAKLQAQLALDRVINTETQFGTVLRYLFTDPCGNRLVWKTTPKSSPRDLYEGQGRVFGATFRVKGHDLYRGEMQTSITHLKLVESAVSQ